MEENPWSKMLEIMRKQSKDYEGIVIGEVLSAPPSLVIKVGDLQVDKDNILIADYLLKDYQREVKITGTTLTGATSYDSNHSHNISSLNINKSKMTNLGSINKGDLLAIATTKDKQTYIVIARLVRL